MLVPYIAERQNEFDANRSRKAPRGQAKSLFKVG
jgi:hypothetical protein